MSTSPAPALPVYLPSRPRAATTAREFSTLVHKRLLGRAAPPTVAGVPVAATRGPVLVLPAVFRGDPQTEPMRGELAQAGYAAFGWGLGTNLGPTTALVKGAARRLLALYEAHGPVNLVGLSLGGLFSRWLAQQHPHAVRQVITVCSPFRGGMDSFFLPLRGVLRRWPGQDLSALATEIAGPLPVPGTFLYTKSDGIVAWQSCIDPAHPEDCLEIPGTHVMIALEPAVRTIILARLGRTLPL